MYDKNAYVSVNTKKNCGLGFGGTLCVNMAHVSTKNIQIVKDD